MFQTTNSNTNSSRCQKAGSLANSGSIQINASMPDSRLRTLLDFLKAELQWKNEVQLVFSLLPACNCVTGLFWGGKLVLIIICTCSHFCNPHLGKEGVLCPLPTFNPSGTCLRRQQDHSHGTRQVLWGACCGSSQSHSWLPYPRWLCNGPTAVRKTGYEKTALNPWHW